MRPHVSWLLLATLACGGAPGGHDAAPPEPAAPVLRGSGPAVDVLLDLDDAGAHLTLARMAQAPAVAPPMGPVIGTAEVLDAAGHVLVQVAIPDMRLTSVIDPDGDHGDHVILDRTMARVTVPWPEGADRIRVGTDTAVPGPALQLTGGAPLATQVVGTGPSSERLDLIFLGDGYTAAEAATFEADVDRMVAHVLSIEPYASYADLFNIWRYFHASNESGADHPELTPPVYRSTTYGCAYNCNSTVRLICCNSSSLVLDAAMALPGAEGIVVLVNDSTYGGSGGSTYASSYTGSLGPEVTAHEMGHSLLGLWDEYSYGVSATTSGGPNCESNAATPRWSWWLGTNGVGAYQPCSYTNLYRPTTNACMMNLLQDQYCSVCAEYAVRQIYGRLPGILSQTTPPAGSVTVTSTTPFSATTIAGALAGSRWTSTWRLDGATVATTPTYDLDPCLVGPGTHTLTLEVGDPTAYVRSDPTGLLEDSAAWTVSTTCLTDDDGDGYTVVDDCDDLDPAVHPGAVEVPFDGTDSNCDHVDGLALAPPALTAGAMVTLHVDGATALDRVYVLLSTTGTGTGPCPAGLGGGCVDVLNPLVASVVADADGVATRTLRVPGGLQGQHVWLQAVQLGSQAQTSPVVPVTVQ
ncbi:MAG: hypothetical protein H6733_09750 [Alphaproteobacteria bacterium]|nr:hypothetical protein [Alphaproteobacteria bacterium]